MWRNKFILNLKCCNNYCAMMCHFYCFTLIESESLNISVIKVNEENTEWKIKNLFLIMTIKPNLEYSKRNFLTFLINEIERIAK